MSLPHPVHELAKKNVTMHDDEIEQGPDGYTVFLNAPSTMAGIVVVAKRCL